MSALDKFKKKLTKKQFNVFYEWLNNKPKTTLLSGGKRSGKTFLLTLMFLIAAKRFKKEEGDIVIAGGSLSSIRRNILKPLETWLGIQIRLGALNQFTLYGQTVYCIGIGNIGSLDKARGFTAKLVLINEVSVLSEEVVKELQDRCSVEGGQVLMDTNPTNKYSYVYLEIIKKGNVISEEGRMLQLICHFCMLDNTTLNKDYIASQLMRYPEGTTDYKRHILGLYASAEGLIYSMFDESRHIIKEMPKGIGISKYIVGQDFGYGIGHAGSMLVIAKLTDGRLIVVDGEIEENKLIDYWQDLLKKYNTNYHIVSVYADHARPDLMEEMRKTRIPIINADKSVDLGINFIKTLLTDGKLLFLEGGCPKKLFKEFGAYVWDSKTDKPIKESDNGLDGLRYCCYTENKLVEEPKTLYSAYKKRGPIQGKKFR